MMKKLSFVLLLFSFSYISPFYYDKASHKAQQGKWADAHEALNELLINQPDSADLLYDAGVAAYNLEKFSQACAYFSRAAEHSDHNTLKKRALFNAGNACVACEQLEDALAQYDALLMLDEKDEYARHNRDKVAEMLQQKQEQEQQKKQQEQQDQEKQSQDEQQKDDQKKDEQQGQEQQKDQQKNNQQGNDQQGSDDQQSGEQNQNQSGSEKQSQNKEGRDGAERSNGDAGQDKRDKKEQSSNAQQDEQRDSDHHSRDKSDQKAGDRNDQARDKHNATPDNGSEKSHQKDEASVPSSENKEQAVGQQGASEDAEHQGQEEIASALENKINDPLLVRILEQQEVRDKAINKQLMEAKIRQNGGKNGQNCW
jgi:hypothetical protein